jgi:hypothetical protein
MVIRRIDKQQGNLGPDRFAAAHECPDVLRESIELVGSD